VNQISSGISLSLSLSLLFHNGNKHIFHCGGGWLRWRLSSMQWFLGWLATKIAILFGAKVNEVNYVLCLLLVSCVLLWWMVTLTVIIPGVPSGCRLPMDSFSNSQVREMKQLCDIPYIFVYIKLL